MEQTKVFCMPGICLIKELMLPLRPCADTECSQCINVTTLRFKSGMVILYHCRPPCIFSSTYIISIFLFLKNILIGHPILFDYSDPIDVLQDLHCNILLA